jgi:hypothetical protein
VRDARASQRRVAVTVDTTTRGRLRLQVRRRGKVIAGAIRRVRSGRHVIGVGRRFASAYYEVRVTLRADRAGGYRDRMRLFTSATLPERLVIPALGDDVRACKRLDSRRIDCEAHDPEDEESGRPCLNTSAYRLFRSGILFTRPYGPRCHRKPIRLPHPHLARPLGSVAPAVSQPASCRRQYGGPAGSSTARGSLGAFCGRLAGPRVRGIALLARTKATVPHGSHGVRAALLLRGEAVA